MDVVVGMSSWVIADVNAVEWQGVTKVWMYVYEYVYSYVHLLEAL